MIPPMLRLVDVARCLGWTGAHRLIALARRGGFPEPVKLGRVWLIEQEAVEKFLAARRLSRIDPEMLGRMAPSGGALRGGGRESVFVDEG